ncbi:MAG TPA: isoprenylcysteine carboxylmethyltransferase family protein [Gemmatimonadales bacterium]|nr:isoprenylcysteine carboxylmethyltransferase family protein [Gemmatimonadales bacterium]
METAIYLVAAALLIAVAFVVFRVIVRRDYQRKGRATLLTSLLEMLVICLYLSFPYLYNPPQWMSVWSRKVPVSEPLRIVGLVCIASGLVSAFGTMFWFGVRRAFGLQVKGLVQSGPYRVTRNPQLVFFVPVLLGCVVLWPSWHALGWAALYGIVLHPMVVTEEEHLLAVFGEEYARYCRRVPRYVGAWWRRQTAAA